MGRIHRVGQTRDVELYNLIAIGTREGEALHTLLDRFVVAANDLDGQMFDSLSLVAEMTGVNYDEWLKALYGDDEDRKKDALDAIGKIRSEELKQAAQKSRAQEAVLASKVDAVAAMTMLQQDVLDRINPAIVEAYLRRLADAGLVTVQTTAAGDGILLVSRPEGLPKSIGGKSGLVATSGQALREAAVHTDTSRVIAIGPGEPAFADIIALADGALAADVFRGGAAQDPTGINNYDLYVYEATLSETDGRTVTPWAVLVRVDDGGQARPVRWETLANLEPVAYPAGELHPAHTHAAESAAKTFATESQERHQRARTDWFSSAKKELQALPTNLTKRIANHEERLAVRTSLTSQVEARLVDLQAMSQVVISPPRLVAYLSVVAAGIPPTPEEKHSELIAMTLVRQHLKERGWRVDNVSTEGRGYDLLGVRGNQQRCVEVKGTWGSAASTGIRMTGNEVLIATQQRFDYWLYVVDQCSDGHGQLFGAFADPVTLFRSDIKAEAIFKVPGSSLNAARDKEQSA
jgi:hypothetical protein